MNNKGKINLFIIIGIFVIQLVIAYFLMTKVVFKDQLSKLPKATEQKVEEVADEIEETNEEDSNADTNIRIKDYSKKYAVLDLKEFKDIVVNPQGENGHFFVCTIGLEYKIKDETLPEEVQSKMYMIQDKINYLLASQNLTDLYNFEYRKILAKSIKDEINSTLTEGRITRVFFRNYVIQ